MTKEHVEVFGGGRCAVIDDFREAVLYQGDAGSRKLKPGPQDKGQKAMLLAWIAGLRNGVCALPFDTAMAVSAAAIGAVESMSIGQPVSIGAQLWSAAPTVATAAEQPMPAEA